MKGVLPSAAIKGARLSALIPNLARAVSRCGRALCSHTAITTQIHGMPGLPTNAPGPSDSLQPVQVRQCQALVSRERDGGEVLTSQEREKVEKMPGWWVAAPG